MHALDTLTEPLDWAMGVVRHLESVATYPELRAAFNAAQPEVSAFYTGIPLNAGLWRNIKAYAATPEAAQLSGARRRFLHKTIETFRRHGADLDPAGKKRLEEIDVELTQITTKFAENVLDSTNAFELVLTNEAELAGLPPTAIASARESAQRKGLEGWRFTLQAPDYFAVMTYLDERHPPQGLRGVRGARHRGRARQPADHRAHPRTAPREGRAAGLRQLRRPRAGRPHGAHGRPRAGVSWRISRARPSAASTKRTRSCWHSAARWKARTRPSWRRGTSPTTPRSSARRSTISTRRRCAPTSRWSAWWADSSNWCTASTASAWRRNRACPRGMPQSIITMSATRKASFWAASTPTGIRARTSAAARGWTALITGGPVTDGFRPHLGLICGNLTPPVGGKPALLTHREVETIFHEFGHLLHHLLSRVEIRSLAGTSVAWDFVELPCQIMENWCWEREALDLFARHYETGAPIPDDLFQKMKRARTFRAANAQMRQLGFGFIDLLLHVRYDAGARRRPGGVRARACCRNSVPRRCPPNTP